MSSESSLDRAVNCLNDISATVMAERKGQYLEVVTSDRLGRLTRASAVAEEENNGWPSLGIWYSDLG
jgi:hypothetical protein